MTGNCKSNYPFSLPDYLPVFDQGEFCQHELDRVPLSWRSESYADEGKTNVTVFEFDQGTGNRFEWDEELLKINLNLQHQPQLRIVLLQPTVQERLAERLLRKNSEARVLLLKNRLAIENNKRSSNASNADANGKNNVGPSQLDISFDALMNLLEHYRIPPAACSHVRGQEQVYGSRLTKDKAGNHESLGMEAPMHYPVVTDPNTETWYAMRARAFVPEETKEADLKITIITRYHFPTRTTFVLLKYRSFNDLVDGLKQEIVRTVDEFIHHPSTARAISDPFMIGVLHFFPIIQYYRRAARGPRDMVRTEEEKVHSPEKSKDIDIRKLHKTLASLDQDVVQLTFILDLIKRLRAEHQIFWTQMRSIGSATTEQALSSVIEESLLDAVSREFDKYENYVTYFRESIREVKGKTERLMDLVSLTERSLSSSTEPFYTDF